MLRDIGLASGPLPRFGHLPLVTGEGNRKLSKRDPQSSLQLYRDRGFLPEGLLNYLALLGWAIAEDRDIFTMAEMIEAFDISRVSSNPARFDLKKAEAINAEHIRRLSDADFVERVIPYLATAKILPESPSDDQIRTLSAIAPLVRERVTVLSDAAEMVRFLFTSDDEFVPESDAAAKALGETADPVLDASIAALEGLPEWTTEAIEQALKAALIDGLGLKPRKAFAPVRVAATGRTVSPPLYESLELLGRERSLGRLRAART